MRNKLIRLIVTISICSILLTACKNGQNTLSIKDCNNTFVIGGFWNIYLFEHEPNSINFSLIKSLKNYSNVDALFLCKKNMLVSSYAYKGINKSEGGVTFFDLAENNTKDYKIHEGSNGLVGVYKNGLLLDTALVQKQKVEPSRGYIHPNNLRTNSENTEEHVFTYTHLFDLDKRKVVKSYAMNQGKSWVVGDFMYSMSWNDVIKTNLLTGYREKIFEQPIPEESIGISTGLPSYSGQVLIGDTIYIVTGENSWNVATDRYSKTLDGFQKNTVYKIENGKLTKVITLPYLDPAYAVALDDDIYIFTKRSNKVMKYSTKSNELTAYEFDSHGFSIKTVGYTDDNFIVILSFNNKIREGGIVVVSHDFSNASDIYKLELSTSTVSVSTSQNIKADDNYRIH